MFNLGRKKKEPDFRTELGQIELPTFPALILHAMERIRNQDVELGAICDELVADPGFTVQILSLVNSAAFGLRREVRSVHHAASLLGRGKLESMLVALAVRNAIPRQNGAGFDNRRFWTASARRAVTGAALAERLDPATRSATFTASLLQDMAVPLLSRHKREHYGDVLNRWHEGEDELSSLEQETFGWDHAEVGAWMCAQWGFPENLTAAICNHHGGDPGDLPAVSLVACLREVNEAPGIDRLVAAAETGHGVPSADTLAIIDRSFVEAEELARLFA